MPRPVVVIGPMGAGKSSVGRRVAKALGVPFTDTDRVIAREHGPIPRLFAERGEPVFRELEAEAVRRAVETGGVVSLGGGAVMHEGTRAAIADAHVVLLTVSAEAVAPRILGSDRPLIATGGITAWQSILDERAPTYERLADLVLDTSRRPMSRVAEDVVAWVRRTTPASARTDGRTDGRPSTPTTSDEGAP
ncbi:MULTISPECIES: shikimate kinase [unclassified Curtobacterium]|uniref:shikimate kinase n=2 Tax=unclassified Curtobacterium TaxID=257496 RepID=UPI0028152EF2|nr:shikimate kinase [Curtobacterium sp. MCBD17_023]